MIYCCKLSAFFTVKPTDLTFIARTLSCKDTITPNLGIKQEKIRAAVTAAVKTLMAGHYFRQNKI